MGFKKTALIATAMLVLGCETTDVQKANLVEGGTKSGVLVKLDGFIPHFQELHLRPNNPSFSSSSLVKFIFEKNQSDYVFTTLKPGHYYIHSLSQQKHWVSCFHSNTISFEVKPNSVTFLGNYNTIKNGAQLQNIALNKGHNRAVQSQVYFYTEDILPPAISQPHQRFTLTSQLRNL